jgi:hypothetical protein
MLGKSWRRGTPAKNSPIAGIANNLLYGSIDEPAWTKLPRAVKHALCKLMRKSYNNIHDPNFYTALHAMWYTNKNFRAKEMRSNITPRFDCSICLETVPLLDTVPLLSTQLPANYDVVAQRKVTTLMCGHHFCSQCIFKYIDCRMHTGGNPSCPMCRANVFEPPMIVPGLGSQVDVVVATEEVVATVNKRIRRQQERWRKRQRIREQKAASPIVNTPTEPVANIINTIYDV